MIRKINDKDIDFYQLMTHSVTARIIIREEVILYANQACMRLLKAQNPDDILHKHIKTFLHPDHYEECIARLRKVVENQETQGPYEMVIFDIEGRAIDIEVTSGVFFFEEEVLVQVTISDITERKQTQALLMQTEKLSTMGELASGIIHEIRNPLMILQGFLELVKGETTEKGESYVKIMAGEVKRMEALTNDLLLFSKPKAQKLVPTNITPVMKDVLFLLENSARKKQVFLQLMTKEEDLTVNCDVSQLKQAFINLIKNAIEATPSHGEVKVIINKVSDENIITISIADTGCGIPDDKLDKVGTSFFSTKEDGTGLGLSVSYNIIHNHQGKVTVTSKEGKGTIFTIELPCHNG